MDDFFEKRERKSIRELNLVPVIDMFTTVIFFLILSTSFYGFTKLTLPPAQVNVNSDPNTPPPVSPKLLISAAASGGDFMVRLSWGGTAPGQLEAIATEQTLEAEVRTLVQKFSEKFPRERALQLGLAPTAKYQAMIRAMDGAREKLPDIVLISPDDGRGSG